MTRESAWVDELGFTIDLLHESPHTKADALFGSIVFHFSRSTQPTTAYDLTHWSPRSYFSITIRLI